MGKVGFVPNVFSHCIVCTFSLICRARMMHHVRHVVMSFLLMHCYQWCNTSFSLEFRILRHGHICEILCVKTVPWKQSCSMLRQQSVMDSILNHSVDFDPTSHQCRVSCSVTTRASTSSRCSYRIQLVVQTPVTTITRLLSPLLASSSG